MSRPLVRDDQPLIIDEAWRASPWQFAQRFSGGQWLPFDWLKLVSDIVQVALARGNARIILTAPPRHGKSEFLSYQLPVWYLNWWPENRVIMASYGKSLATYWGAKVRDALRDNPLSWTTLNPTKESAGDFITPQGGGMLSVGTSGSATGRGGNLILVDDIHKDWEEAQSKVYRDKTINFFNGTLYTRKEPGASIFVIQTRWHQSDLVGYLTSKHSDNWIHIDLPALARKHDLLLRQEGEALCPQRYTREMLLAIKKAIGSQKFASLFQQQPSDEEGGVIKRAWFRHYMQAPSDPAEVLQYWDLSLKGESQSDYVVGQTWCRNGPEMYLLDQIRGQFDFPATIGAIKTMINRWPQTQAVYIEDAANGPAAVSVLRKHIARIIAVPARGSKFARLSAAAPAFEAGNAHFPDPAICSWVGDLEEELVTFPNAQNDDQCDVTSGAIGRYQIKSATTSAWAI